MAHIDRDEAIRQIKSSLKERSGRQWSVTGGRGTAWGWIHVKAVKAWAVDEYGTLSDTDAKLLAKLLDFKTISIQGASIPSGSDYYREYMDRAAGQTPSVYGQPYWD